MVIAYSTNDNYTSLGTISISHFSTTFAFCVVQKCQIAILMINSTLISLSLSKIYSASPLFTPKQNSNFNIFKSTFSKSFSNFLFSANPIRNLQLTESSFTHFTKSVLYITEEYPFAFSINLTSKTFTASQRFNETGDSILISRCLFDSCKSNNRGGAIYIFFARSIHCAIERTTFAQCASSNKGGAISMNIGSSYFIDICAYQCYCGEGFAGNCYDISSDYQKCERNTFVECSSEAVTDRSTCAVFDICKLCITDWNETSETSTEEGGIYFSKIKVETINRLLFKQVFCNEMLKISPQTNEGAALNNIALISCTAISLLTPQSDNINITGLIVQDCSEVLVHSSNLKYQMLIFDSYFDHEYQYQYLTNCVITETKLFDLVPNNISQCAKGIKLFSLINTKLSDIIISIVGIVILIILLIISVIWYCFLHIPINQTSKLENQLKMSLPLVDESDTAQTAPILTLRL